MGATRKITSKGIGAVRSTSTTTRSPSKAPPRFEGHDEPLTGERPRPRSSKIPPASTTKPADPNATARRRAARVSIRVDDVGESALGLSAKRSQTPRLAKGKKDLASAPIDPRAAYLLSQVDGRLTVDDLADITAIPREEVLQILERMARLGILLLS